MIFSALSSVTLRFDSLFGGEFLFVLMLPALPDAFRGTRHFDVGPSQWLAICYSTAVIGPGLVKTLQ